LLIAVPAAGRACGTVDDAFVQVDSHFIVGRVTITYVPSCPTLRAKSASIASGGRQLKLQPSNAFPNGTLRP
jgi:hypothetical protein